MGLNVFVKKALPCVLFQQPSLQYQAYGFRPSEKRESSGHLIQSKSTFSDTDFQIFIFTFRKSLKLLDLSDLSYGNQFRRGRGRIILLKLTGFLF